MNNKKINAKVVILFFLFISCESSSSFEDEYIDPQIVFSSRRWWNYDIFITDIYSSKMTQITKNKWIDFHPIISPRADKISFVSDRNGNREIYIANLEWMDGYMQWRASDLNNITNSIENDWTPSFSPTEDKIIFSTYFPENDNYDIFLMDDNGNNKENLTNSPSYEKYPQFSPDGSYIIYQGWQKGKMEIFFLGLLDKSIINITMNSDHNDILSHGNSFSEDGHSIVFTSERGGNKDIFIMKINGSEVEQLTTHKANDYEPTFAPFGESIIFTSERDGNKEIYSLDIKTKNLRNLTNDPGDDWNSRFYPDGNKIVFQSTRDGNWEIYKMNRNGSRQTNLTNHPSTDYSFSIIPLRTQ